MSQRTKVFVKDLRTRLADAILRDAEQKAAGKGTRIERLICLVALLALLAGYLLATQTNATTIGGIVFFGSFGSIVGATLAGWLPTVRRMRYRLERCGLTAAAVLWLPDLMAAYWAIGEMARQSERQADQRTS